MLVVQAPLGEERLQTTILKRNLHKYSVLLCHNFRKLSDIVLTIPKPLALQMEMKRMSQFKVLRTLLRTTGIMGKVGAVTEHLQRFLLELRS